VLREACERTSAWQATFPALSQLAICVNLSPSELQSPGLTGDVAAVLDETGLAPDRLILEITENGAMRDPLRTIETLRELRMLGVRLALDDFGTGHSSLSHLRDFPITMLKIAKPFVDTLGNGRINTTFIDAIFQLARALELEAVAEGVEKPAQSEMLCRLRCDLGQGYHFSRPLDTAGAEAHLAATSPTDRPFAHVHAA
jgi:EAL domain-containing protein (putative c-di-GMP-specific phosphodiesterase class I)